LGKKEKKIKFKDTPKEEQQCVYKSVFSLPTTQKPCSSQGRIFSWLGPAIKLVKIFLYDTTWMISLPQKPTEQTEESAVFWQTSGFWHYGKSSGGQFWSVDDLPWTNHPFIITRPGMHS